MARVAGNKGYYNIGLLDANGNPTGLMFQFDSVTTVLNVVAKPSLMHWYYKEGIAGVAELLEKYGNKIPHDVESLLSLMKTEKLAPYNKRDTAASKGTDIHAELEAVAKGELKAPTTEGLLNWWEARHLSPSDIIMAEQPLVSFQNMVAGTPDLIYRDPATQRVVCADLKTGKHIAWTHFTQGEAYKMMSHELSQLGAHDVNNVFSKVPPIDDVTVLHVREPGAEAGKRGWQELRSPEVTVESFYAALKLYRSLPVKWSAENMDEDLIV